MFILSTICMINDKYSYLQVWMNAKVRLTFYDSWNKEVTNKNSHCIQDSSWLLDSLFVSEGIKSTCTCTRTHNIHT